MKKHRSISKRITALLLLLVLTLPLLAACESRPIPAGELALSEVGSVGEYDVLYEELYFLVHNDLPALQDKYGEDTDAILEELEQMLSEQVLQNYARLRLCEMMGLSFDEDDLRDEAQAYVDALIKESFEGDRDAYIAGLREIGMTDHYLRFTAMVDALYDRLPAAYGEEGKIPVSDEEIRAYVKEHFVRTRHIAVLVESGESYEENYQKAETALSLLEDGKSMHELIGSKYNEDITLTTTDGYYFARGSMEQAYEDAAFALEENGHSGIIEARGVSNLTGESVICFYILERLPLESGYINSHLTALADDCANAIIAADLEDHVEALRFEGNELYESLDLCELDFPEDGIDWALILLWAGIVLLAAAVIVLTVLLICHIHKKRRETVKALMRK